MKLSKKSCCWFLWFSNKLLFSVLLSWSTNKIYLILSKIFEWCRWIVPNLSMSKVEKKKRQWRGLPYPDDTTNAKLYILFRTDSHQISRTELALSLYGVFPGPLVQCISVTYPRLTAGRLRGREVKNHTLSSPAAHLRIGYKRESPPPEHTPIPSRPQSPTKSYWTVYDCLHEPPTRDIVKCWVMYTRG